MMQHFFFIFMAEIFQQLQKLPQVYVKFPRPFFFKVQLKLGVKQRRRDSGGGQIFNQRIRDRRSSEPRSYLRKHRR